MPTLFFPRSNLKEWERNVELDGVGCYLSSVERVELYDGDHNSVPGNSVTVKKSSS